MQEHTRGQLRMPSRNFDRALAHHQLAMAACNHARFVFSPTRNRVSCLVLAIVDASTILECGSSPPLFISSPDTHLAYVRISFCADAACCGQGRGTVSATRPHAWQLSRICFQKRGRSAKYCCSSCASLLKAGLIYPLRLSPATAFIASFA